MNKLSVNFIDSFGISYDECAKIIAECGFDGIFDTFTSEAAAEALASAAAKHRLEITSFHAPFFGINSMWLDGEEGDNMLLSLLAAVDSCERYSAPVAVVHVSSGETPPQMSEIGFARYDKLVETAAKKGVMIGFENLRKPMYLDAVMERYRDCKNVGFCWDTGHEACFTYGQEFMPDYGGRLCFTHIHDNLGEHNEDLHRIPFDGSLDFKRIAKRLRERAWQGYLSFEVYPDKYETKKTAEMFYKRAYAAAVKIRSMAEGE